MKRHILFVDDESQILDGLRRSLRPRRREWDMHFVASGKEALQVLETHPIDVIVSDMRMPGMDGATLLRMVKEKYPHLVRIILSGYSDNEIVVKSTDTAHEFLAKPCKPETLAITINSTCAIKQLLDTEKLQQTIMSISTLPSVPLLYQKLVEELKRPDSSANRVGEIIAMDAAMTARVIQLTNSAFFGLSRRITSPVEAANLLGIDTLIVS